MAQPEKPVLEQEHVLTASGEFDVHDAPIDIGIYRLEEWIAFVFFWALSCVIFLQFFTRYAMNCRKSRTSAERNPTLPGNDANVNRRERQLAARGQHMLLLDTGFSGCAITGSVSSS